MRGLRFLLAATAASVTGDGMLVAATPLAAAALSRDPADIGVVAAASTAAWLLFGVPAGALVDRWDLRRTMIVSDLVRFLSLAALGLLMLAGQASITALSAAVFVVGIATCFFTPAGVALLRDIVGSSPTDLAVANGRFWSIDAFGRSLAGPPLGAYAFGFSRALPFLVDALSFGISALLLVFTPAPRRTTVTSRLGVTDGLRFLWSRRELRALALSAWSFNFAYATVFAPFVLYAQDRLGVGALGFGLLLACGAAGSIVAGLLVPRLLATRPALSVYSGVFIAQAVAWAVILLIAQPIVAGLALALLGGAATVGTVAGQATRQLTTPVSLLGRVAAVHRIASSGGGTLGALAGGLIAASFGASAPFVVAIAFLVPCAVLSALVARGATPMDHGRQTTSIR
jgi:MFS family permease